jgi:hypothetical protein
MTLYIKNKGVLKMTNTTTQILPPLLGGTVANLAVIGGVDSVWLMLLGGVLSMVGVLHDLLVDREEEEHTKGYVFMTGLRGLLIGAVTAPMVYIFLRDMGKKLLGDYTNINIETISNGFLFFFSLWVAWYSSIFWDYAKEVLLKKREKLNKGDK